MSSKNKTMERLVTIGATLPMEKRSVSILILFSNSSMFVAFNHEKLPYLVAKYIV
jgi:hypothetical protein